jgi:hypothetical protein
MILVTVMKADYSIHPWKDKINELVQRTVGTRALETSTEE